MQSCCCFKEKNGKGRVNMFALIIKIDYLYLFVYFIRFYLSCRAYPTCKKTVWFPSSVLKASVTDEYCQTVFNLILIII
jgi:hypothetical protein